MWFYILKSLNNHFIINFDKHLSQYKGVYWIWISRDFKRLFDDNKIL